VQRTRGDTYERFIAEGFQGSLYRMPVVRDRRGRDPWCNSCEQAVDGSVLESLRQIVSLPEAIGGHACECGHPEMRRLPDGVFWCPACGSEVLPLKPSWST
jgi:hypothetical protein